jgi:hypothetical protein
MQGEFRGADRADCQNMRPRFKAAGAAPVNVVQHNHLCVRRAMEEFLKSSVFQTGSTAGDPADTCGRSPSALSREGPVIEIADGCVIE